MASTERYKRARDTYQKTYQKQSPLYEQYLKDVEAYESSPLHDQYKTKQAQLEDAVQQYKRAPTPEGFSRAKQLEQEATALYHELRSQHGALQAQEKALAPLFESATAVQREEGTLDALRGKNYTLPAAGIIDAVVAAETGKPVPESRQPLRGIGTTEESPWYGGYTALSDAATTYRAKVSDPYESWATQHLGTSGDVRFTVGLAKSPAELAETVGMAIPGTERAWQAVKARPVETAAYLIPGGLTYMVSSMAKGLKEDPGEFAGSMVGQVLLTKGAGKGVKATAPPVVRQVTKLSPGYERGMTMYTGVPRIRDVLFGDATLQQYREGKPTRFTPPADRSKIVDPALAKQEQSFYHATSDVFGQLSAMDRVIRVDAGKPSVVESSMFFGPPETGLARFLPSDGSALIKVRAPVQPYSPRVTSLIQQGAPRSVIEPLVYREFHRAPAGKIVPGVKPAAGKTFHGELQWEYMAKPGTKLYRVENWRTRAYDQFGLTRGTGWTRDPLTGRKVEVYEFSLDPPPKTAAVKPVVDIPAMQRRLFYNPVYEQVVFGTRKAGSALKAPARLIDERVAERTLVREMKKKGIPAEDIRAFQAGVRLGRAVKGMDSPVTGDIILDALTEIGPEYAADIQTILRENPTVLYGSGIATGQTPRPVWWRGFKDLDVHLERKDIPKFIRDARAMYKRHGHDVVQRGLSLVDKKTGTTLLDIHEAPKNYPLIGKKDAPGGPYEDPPKTRPFSFIPDDLLRGPDFLQERLYTQAQRKLSSITEQLERGKIKESRVKDFGDGIMTVEALLDYAESQLRPGQMRQARKLRGMREDLNILKNHPKIKLIWEETLKNAQEYRAANEVLLDNALRKEFGIPRSVKHLTPDLLKQISEKQFLESRRITKPTPEMIEDARAAVARGRITSKQVDAFLAERIEQANRMFAEAVSKPVSPPVIRVSSRPPAVNWREPGTLLFSGAMKLPVYAEVASFRVDRGTSAADVVLYGASTPHLERPSSSPTLAPSRSPSTREGGVLSPRSPVPAERSPSSIAMTSLTGRSPSPVSPSTVSTVGATPPSPPGSTNPLYDLEIGTQYDGVPTYDRPSIDPSPYPDPVSLGYLYDLPPAVPPPPPPTKTSKGKDEGTGKRKRGKYRKKKHWEFGAGADLPEAAAIVFGFARPRQPAREPSAALSPLLGRSNPARQQGSTWIWSPPRPAASRAPPEALSRVLRAGRPPSRPPPNALATAPGAPRPPRRPKDNSRALSDKRSKPMTTPRTPEVQHFLRYL